MRRSRTSHPACTHQHALVTPARQLSRTEHTAYPMWPPHIPQQTPSHYIYMSLPRIPHSIPNVPTAHHTQPTGRTLGGGLQRALVVQVLFKPLLVAADAS
eukprot:3570447-Rhodomonas_salina.1